MRRKEREITDIDQQVKMIDLCQVLRLGLSDEGSPYIVPLNFGYEVFGSQIVFYFHSSSEGRKMDLLKKNNQVCFELDYLDKIVTDPIACKWTAHYGSIIGCGTVDFLIEAHDKKTAMDHIMRKYGYQGESNYDPLVLSKTALCRLTVSRITAKSNCYVLLD